MTFEEACSHIPPGGRLCYIHNQVDKWEAAVFIHAFDIGRGEGATFAEAIINAIANTHPRNIFHNKPIQERSVKTSVVDLLAELGL